jgi:hypothetical protein
MWDTQYFREGFERQLSRHEPPADRVRGMAIAWDIEGFHFVDMLRKGAIFETNWEDILSEILRASPADRSCRQSPAASVEFACRLL